MSNNLKRKMKGRHVQMIAMGGAIGTGLFLGSSTSIILAGPSVLLGYMVAGFIAYLILRQLGEMIVEEPVEGSFSYFAKKYWSSYVGFMAGWNYWLMFIIVSIAELTAIGIYVRYWFPDIPSWLTASIFFVVLNFVNLTSVKIFAETEYILSLIKILAVSFMIIFGIYLIISGKGGEDSHISNLWGHGGMFPNGFSGLSMAMASIFFSFGGIEMIGMTAAETENPKKTLPAAINQMIFKVAFFYIGSMAVILILCPWNKISENISPFVMIFSHLQSENIASILNAMVLLASISVFNSSIYSNSRMLHSLANKGDAPRLLRKTNENGVPVMAVMFSGVATSSGVALNYFFADKIFGYLMALSVTILIINWSIITITHLKFKTKSSNENRKSTFPDVFYPFGNFICLLFMILIVYFMSESKELRFSVILVPLWILVTWLIYRVINRKF